MIRVRYWITGRDKADGPERVLGLTDDLWTAHKTGLERIVSGHEDVKVRDNQTETQWVPVPWSTYLDDHEDDDAEGT